MLHFYLYSPESYENGEEADKATALYALTAIDSFDEPSHETTLEDLMAGAQAAAECLGYDAPSLCYKVDDEGPVHEVINIAGLFNG